MKQYIDYSGVFLTGGLSPERARKRYRDRRLAFRKKLNAPALLYGVDRGPGDDEVWSHLRVPIYQEPLILFLTGVNQQNTALYLAPASAPEKEEPEILFLPKKDAEKEFWDGLRLGSGFSESEDEAVQLTGIKKILPFEDLARFTEKTLKGVGGKGLNLFWHERKARSVSKLKKVNDSKSRFKKKCEALARQLGKNPDTILRNVSDVAWHFRRPLDAEDQASAFIANEKTGQAFRALLKKIHSTKNEMEVRGILEGELLRRTSHGLSFPSIVAVGKNAAVLHYEKADSPMKKGDLLLLDFGLKWQGIHADISRTIPVNGTFNPLQKLLYEVVLDTQLFYEKQAKPGETMKQLNDRAWEYLNDLLKKRFTSRGGTMTRPYEKAPHGLSHLIGLAIHDGDPFGDYKEEKLEPGWMISNEPGLYGQFTMELGKKVYRENLGIRIEDDLVITKTGCVNLSRGIPKKVADLEKLLINRHSS